MKLAEWLLEPRLRGIDLQGYDRIGMHAQILASKPLMREVFREFYSTCAELDRRYFVGVEGARIELGAGTSLFKADYPEIISTDVQPAAHLDMVIDAEAMPLGDRSVRAFYGINCFHHFPHPERFFAEILRTLKPGGGCVLIEPYFGPLAARLYPRLFASEAYNKEATKWSYVIDPESAEERPNQALSYVVFFRDRQKFEGQFPQLEIVHRSIMKNYLRYIFSGGLNFRQLVPSRCGLIVKTVEGALGPCRVQLGLHHVVVLRKRASPS